MARYWWLGLLVSFAIAILPVSARALRLWLPPIKWSTFASLARAALALVTRTVSWAR
jgi:hypothetical protein